MELRTNIAASTALLVDDDPLFRSLVREHLESLGFMVVEAGEGATALHKLARLVPDIVCLDLMLPEVSGFHVCESIRNTPALRDVPVLMMSARSHPQDRAQAEACGVSDYLIKPFSIDDLSAAVRRLLFPRTRRARR